MTSVEASSRNDSPGNADSSGRLAARWWTRWWTRASRYSLARAGIALVVALGVAKLGVPLGRNMTPAGDIALIELGVRQALHHGNALGVYSRFGWHHPGPALFYLLAPAYFLSAESSRSLFLGAWLINAGSMLGAVWIVRARAGEQAARVAAIVLLAFLMIARFIHVIDPWNPKLLALPMLVLMIAAGGACAGSAWSFVVALVAASYLVQSHIGTLPVSAALLALAGAGFWWDRRPRRDEDRDPEDRRRSLRAPIVVAAALLSLLWVGPIVQELTHSHGNLSQIVGFYRHPAPYGPKSHSLRSSLIVVTNRSTVFPLGNPKDTLGHRGRLLTAGGFAALGLAAAVLARRRSRFVAALGLTTAIGLGVAVVAATRVIGPQDGYLFYWCETLPIPAVVAGSWVAIDRARDLRPQLERAIAAATAIALVLVVVLTLRTILHAKNASTGDAASERAVAMRIERELGTRKQHFTLHVDTTALEEDAVALQLDKDGYHFHAEPSINLYNGNIGAAVAGPTFEIRFAATPDPVASDRHLATVGKIELLQRR